MYILLRPTRSEDHQKEHVRTSVYTRTYAYKV